MPTPPSDRRWVRVAEQDDSELLSVLRGLDVVSMSRIHKQSFRSLADAQGCVHDEIRLRAWWPAADRPSARDIAQAVLRG